MKEVVFGRASIILHNAWHQIAPKSMENRLVVVGNIKAQIIWENNDINSEYDNDCCCIIERIVSAETVCSSLSTVCSISD